MRSRTSRWSRGRDLAEGHLPAHAQPRGSSHRRQHSDVTRGPGGEGVHGSYDFSLADFLGASPAAHPNPSRPQDVCLGKVIGAWAALRRRTGGIECPTKHPKDRIGFKFQGHLSGHTPRLTGAMWRPRRRATPTGDETYPCAGDGAVGARVWLYRVGNWRRRRWERKRSRWRIGWIRWRCSPPVCGRRRPARSD